MQLAALPVVEGWLREPHVARWWTRDTTAEAHLSKYQRRIVGPVRDGDPRRRTGRATAGLVPVVPLGALPAAAQAMDAAPGEVGSTTR